MTCRVLTPGCVYAGATLYDAGLTVLDAAGDPVDTTSATVVYQWYRDGDDSVAVIDLTEASAKVTRAVGVDNNGVTVTLAAADTALTPGWYTVYYTVTATDTYKATRKVEVK